MSPFRGNRPTLEGVVGVPPGGPFPHHPGGADEPAVAAVPASLILAVYALLATSQSTTTTTSTGSVVPDHAQTVGGLPLMCRDRDGRPSAVSPDMSATNTGLHRLRLTTLFGVGRHSFWASTRCRATLIVTVEPVACLRG